MFTADNINTHGTPGGHDHGKPRGNARGKAHIKSSGKAQWEQGARWASGGSCGGLI